MDKMLLMEASLSEKKVFLRPNNSEDLLKVIEIILKAKIGNEKTLVFFTDLWNDDKYEKKLFVLNEASKLENKYIVTNLAKKLEKPSLRFSYPLIENYTQKYKNSAPTLALILISHQESNFKVNAYSSAGARGVMS